MKKVLYFMFVSSILFFAGCTSAPTITSSQRTQMRTKTFDSDYKTTFRSLMIVFENHGYTIDNTDMDSGLIKATSVKDASNSFMKVMYGATEVATYDISSTVSKASKNSTRVRINLRQKSDSRMGYYSSVSANDIDTPEVYQSLFNDLRTEIERMKAIN